MTTEKNKGGRLTLAQQAEHNHNNASTRVDLEISKMTLKVIKHLNKMVNKIETYKENTQLALVDKVLNRHEAYMKAKEELDSLKAPHTEETETAEEEFSPMVSLSSTSENNKLN